MRQPDWQTPDGRVKLWCGDCIDILPTLPKVDACVTDPPYGVNIGGRDVGGNWRKHNGHGLTKAAYASHEDTYARFVSDIVPRLTSAIELAGRAAVFSGPHIHEQRKPDAIGGVYCSAACGRHAWGFKNLLPVLFYGSAAGLQFGAKEPTVLCSNAVAETNGHPCPKPLDWMLWLCRIASLEDETILDPFMGSGTTGVACVRLGRQFLGIEKEERYFDIAVKRITREIEQGTLAFPEPERFEAAELFPATPPG